MSMSEKWSSQPPDTCPFEQSTLLKGCVLTGRYANYTDADTWYPSWGSDGNQYSPFTDTVRNGVNGVMSNSAPGADAVVGHATIVGDDPTDLQVIRPGIIPGPGNDEYRGRYPSASLHYNGTWYIGTYGLASADYGLNWPILGPFGGFHMSHDDGKAWIHSPLSTEVGSALFPEPTVRRGPVKMGAPHVVDFGQNMEHSPDGKLYLVGHGSTEMDGETRNANLSWITGDQIYLCRVEPSPESVNDLSRYEFFAGRTADGAPQWSSDFADLQPIAEWPDNMGCVTITYNAPLSRYLMWVTDGWPTIEQMSSYVLESDSITGPWRLVHYFKELGPQAYFLNFPSKFISRDGRSAWLCLSANFTNNDTRTDPNAGDPRGCSYSMALHEVSFLID